MSAKDAPTTIVESSETDLSSTHDLSTALSAIVLSQSNTRLQELQQVVRKIQGYFDPATVTMTSTNIPDSVTKLSTCLQELTDETTKVFALIEREKDLVSQGEKILSTIEAEPTHASKAETLPKLCAQLRSIHEEIRACSHQIVLAHESTDLISQKIRKVMAVVQDIEPSLRELLRQLNVSIPTTQREKQHSDDSDLDQAAADAILKDLGISN